MGNKTIDNLSIEEKKMIEKGKDHWDLDILKRKEGGYVSSDTIKDVIDMVIENTWTQAKEFYNK